MANFTNSFSLYLDSQMVVVSILRAENTTFFYTPYFSSGERFLN